MEFGAVNSCAELMARLVEPFRRAVAQEGRQNHCKWIVVCYSGGPNPAVQHAIRNRHLRAGYLASYQLALKIVHHELDTGEGPTLASWF